MRSAGPAREAPRQSVYHRQWLSVAGAFSRGISAKQRRLADSGSRMASGEML